MELFQLLITKFKEKQPLYIEAFFELSVTFLSHHFQIHKGGRNHSITFYYYPIPNTDVIKEFRKEIWLTLFENYDLYPIRVLSIIKHFKPGYQEPIKEILELPEFRSGGIRIRRQERSEEASCRERVCVPV